MGCLVEQPASGSEQENSRALHQLSSQNGHERGTDFRLGDRWRCPAHATGELRGSHPQLFLEYALSGWVSGASVREAKGEGQRIFAGVRLLEVPPAKRKREDGIAGTSGSTLKYSGTYYAHCVCTPCTSPAPHAARQHAIRPAYCTLCNTGATCNSCLSIGRPWSSGAAHSKCSLLPSLRTNAGGSGGAGTEASVSTVSTSDQGKPEPPGPCADGDGQRRIG